MIRILALLAACLLTAPLLLGCAVKPGLANTPQLGGTPDVDSRVQDAIANGPDSCGRMLDPGPLRNRVIPCAQMTGAPSTSSSFAPVTSQNAIVKPWVEHFYWRWACPSVDRKLRLPSPEFGGNSDAIWTGNASSTGEVAFSSRCPTITSPR
jgi:hypothetical protein